VELGDGVNGVGVCSALPV